MKALLVATFGCCALLAGTHAGAQSQDKGFYAGASLGITSLDVDTKGLPVSVDDSTTGAKIYGGYQFTRNWGAEIGVVNFGDIKFGSPVSGSLKFNAFTVAGVGTMPLDTRWSAFGKAGLYNWKTKGTASSPGVLITGDSGTDLMLGGGVLYNIDKTFAVQGEFEYFGGSDTVTMLSAGLRIRF